MSLAIDQGSVNGSFLPFVHSRAVDEQETRRNRSQMIPSALPFFFYVYRCEGMKMDRGGEAETANFAEYRHDAGGIALEGCTE